MPTAPKLNFDDLMRLAGTSHAVARACVCDLASYHEWTRIPATFPEAQMDIVGTLADDPYVEATYAEYHPAGTSYWSAAAPIAPRHFPYNRCEVLRCEVCSRAALKYVEAGGYYVEPRVRLLDPGLLIDAPAPD
ncbi:hypothetical protein [Massilia sp. 9096]|uniref:hypothetical protein n=1 Tax=Massilia sp. 9096 TaxID=1500894 RepID=UPI0005699DA6|nr:hypothetical protein [Massilia sp. 9096]